MSEVDATVLQEFVRDRADLTGETLEEAAAAIARELLAPMHAPEVEHLPVCVKCGRDAEWNEAAHEWRHRAGGS